VRLLSILEMRRVGPDGQPHQSTAYVFGRETTGERMSIASFRTAWEQTMLKAHGYEPELVRGKLSPASREAMRAIGLHFHDLRREAGSRFLEAGFSLTAVSRMLGHAKVTATAIYLGIDDEQLHQEIEMIDRYNEEQERKAHAIRPLSSAGVEAEASEAPKHVH
jgi:integrase